MFIIMKMPPFWNTAYLAAAALIIAAVLSGYIAFLLLAQLF